MIRQIREILLTYLRRPLSGPLPFFMVLIPLIGILQVAMLPLQFSISGSWMALYMPALIGIHLKQQVLHIRERRLPSALYLHLAIGVGIFLLVGLGLPLVRMAVAHQWSVGLLGLVLAATAVVFGAVITGSSVFFAAPVLLVAVLYVPATRQWVVDLCEGRNEQAGIALVACGLAAIWASMAYLRELTEEDRAYHQRLDLSAQNAYQRGTIQSTQVLNSQYRKGRWFNPPDPSEADTSRWPALARGSLWERAKLVAVVNRPTRGTVFSFLLFPIFLVAPALLRGNPANVGQLRGFLFFFVFAGTIVPQQWLQRHATWAFESLRPATRRRFILEQGLAMARSMALLMILPIAGWLAIMAIFAPSMMLEPITWEIVAGTAVAQIFVFGCSVWLMRHRARGVFSLVLLPVFILGFVTSLLALRGTAIDPADAAVWLVATVAVSGLILWDAYRRWLNTELG
jgi:hypothetical protein